MKYKTDSFTAKRTVTRHTCQRCAFVYYVRASFYNCPNCNTENRTPVILESCRSFPALVHVLMTETLRHTADKEAAIKNTMKQLPGNSYYAIKSIWEEIEPIKET